MRVSEAGYSSVGLDTAGIAVLDLYIARIVTVMVDSIWSWRRTESLIAD